MLMQERKCKNFPSRIWGMGWGGPSGDARSSRGQSSGPEGEHSGFVMGSCGWIQAWLDRRW